MRRVTAAVLGVAATTVLAAAVGAQAPPKHFLWTVQAPGAPVVYLLGSLHALTPDHYPLAPRIEAAFADSTVLVEEVDLDELTSPATVMTIMAKAMLPDGRTLDQVVAPELYRRVAERATAAGLPVAAIRRMKPWLAAVSLVAPALNAAGLDARHGVDQYFFDKAKARQIERRALETVSYQFDRLDQLPPALQEAMLRSVIDDLDTQLANIKTMAAAWTRGETAVLERLLLDALRESPDLYERLLVERNRNWVEHVAGCVASRTRCFVVVGAAHLVGPHSLVELLRAKGYAVEQQ